MSHTTLRLNKAAEFLNLSKETIRRRAATGEIPSARVGRAWIFLEEDLVAYLRSLYSRDASQSAANVRSKKLWHSINEMGFGGSMSPTKDVEYEKVLGLA